MGAKEIKELLLSDEDLEMGIITYTVNDEYRGEYTSTQYIGTKKEMLLSNLYGNPYPKELHTNYMYDRIDNVNSFETVKADASLEVREMLAAEQKRRAELVADVKRNPNKYNIPGMIKMGGETIEVTAQELIEAGLNPEQLGWISERDFKRGKKPEVTHRKIIVPEETKLAKANKDVSSLRTSLDSIDIKALEEQENDLEKKSDTVEFSERDSSTEVRKSVQTVESRIRANETRKKLLEDHIKLVQSVLNGEPGKALDAIYDGMKTDFPNIDTEDILKYNSSTEKSISTLMAEVGKMPEEFGLEKLLEQLQSLLAKCNQRLDELNANKQQGESQHKEALKKEIRDTLLGKSGSEIGLIVQVTDDQFSNTYRESVFVGTEKEAKLSNRFGIPLREEIHTAHLHDPIDIYNEYRGDSKLTLAQMNAIAGRKKSLEDLQRQVKENPERFSKAGVVVIAGIAIDVTEQELIEAGVDPNTFGWRTIEEYNQNKESSGSITNVVEPELSELSMVTQLVKNARGTLEGVDYRYLTGTAKDLDEDANMEIHPDDSSKDSAKNESYLTESIRKNSELKARIEAYIAQVSAINFEDISTSVENAFANMQEQYPNLDADDILKYDSETEKSIKNLRNDLEGMMKEFKLPEVLSGLQEMLARCDERATALETRLQEAQKQKVVSKTREIKELMFSEDDHEVGIITSVRNDEYRGEYSVQEHVGSKKEMKLSNLYGSPFVQEFHGNYQYDTIEAYNVFEDSGLTDEQKAKVEEETRRREAMLADVKANPEQYSKSGIITIDGVEIQVTKAELIEAGLNPDEMKWREPVREDKSVKGILQKMVRSCTSKMPKVAEAAAVVKRHLEKNKDKGEQTYDE